MATLNREQLIQYIKNLEQKVRKYQALIKKRDEEIAVLREKIEQFNEAHRGAGLEIDLEPAPGNSFNRGYLRP